MLLQRSEDEQGRPVKRGYGYSGALADRFTHYRPGNPTAEGGGVATWTIGGGEGGELPPMPAKETAAPGEAAAVLRASEEALAVSGS